MDPASDIWNGQSELTISPGHVLVLHMVQSLHPVADKWDIISNQSNPFQTMDKGHVRVIPQIPENSVIFSANVLTDLPLTLQSVSNHLYRSTPTSSSSSPVNWWRYTGRPHQMWRPTLCSAFTSILNALPLHPNCRIRCFKNSPADDLKFSPKTLTQCQNWLTNNMLSAQIRITC